MSDDMNGVVAVFDLTKTQPVKDGRIMIVVHPNGQLLGSIDKDGTPHGSTITLLGADSDEYKSVRNASGNRRLDASVRRGNIVAGSLEEIESDTLDALVAATVSWTNFKNDGQDIPCTPANVRMVYVKVPWLRRQVDKFVADDANFLPASSKA